MACYLYDAGICVWYVVCVQWVFVCNVYFAFHDAFHLSAVVRVVWCVAPSLKFSVTCVWCFFGLSWYVLCSGLCVCCLYAFCVFTYRVDVGWSVQSERCV